MVCHRDFDAGLALLYSKNAHLEQVGRMAGHDRVILHLRFDPRQWKKLLPKLMLEAKAKEDRSRFSDWTFTELPDSVVILATRYSELNDYSAPHRVVIARAENDEWWITEETMNVLKRAGL